MEHFTSGGINYLYSAFCLIKLCVKSIYLFKDPEMSSHILETSIEFLKGVGPGRAEILRKELNIYCFGDLILYFPFRYVDRSRFYRTCDVSQDMSYIQLKGKIAHMQILGHGRSGRLVAQFRDEAGSIELVWFKGLKWIKDKVIPGKEYVVFGKPAYFNGRYNIPHPEIERIDEYSLVHGETLQAVYSTTEKARSKGMDSRGIGKLVKVLLPHLKGRIPETLSISILKKHALINREEALLNIHLPRDPHMLKQANSRLKFEELFFMQLRLLKFRQFRLEKLEGIRFSKIGKAFNHFYHQCLEFELTDAQKKVVREIRTDLGSGRQMNRLLQGDVGSGKTVVALMSMLIAIDNGYQTAIMAPTEILAMQHFNTVTAMLKGSGLNVRLLTGSTKAAERKEIHAQLLSGELHIIVGTHALIEESVKFKSIGLVVIDEQHRFGVAQRAKFWKKSKVPPHVLVMTATPIPRTLAMTVYGDLDYSVIDQLPPGRKTIKTYHYHDKDRLKVFGFLRKKIAEGRQIYIVYPLIQESEKMDLKDLMDGYESVIREFPLPKYAVSILHGRMKPEDKEYEMQRFAVGETQIMVSTTVIEVGVDVPNATVMIIENAERYGLSQLHQLRGRVGRGDEQSHCILMTSYKLSNDGRKRIETMVTSTDGFYIAKVDLHLRGPGDMEGTQQSGLLDLRIADISRDGKLLALARDNALELIQSDGEFERTENFPVKRQFIALNKNKANWSLIS